MAKTKTVSEKLTDFLGKNAGLHPVHFSAYQDAGYEHKLGFTLENQEFDAEGIKKLHSKIRMALIKVGLHSPPQLRILTNQEIGRTHVILSGTSDLEKATLAGLHAELQRRLTSVTRKPQNMLHQLPTLVRKMKKRALSETFR